MRPVSTMPAAAIKPGLINKNTFHLSAIDTRSTRSIRRRQMLELIRSEDHIINDHIQLIANNPSP